MSEPSPTPHACDLLLAAAFAPELLGLEPLLGPALAADVGGLSVAASPVGIGMVAAASGAASRLARGSPRAVVLLGTCGAYPGSGLRVGDVVVAGSVLLLEPAVIDGEAAFPGPMSAPLAAHVAMSAALAASPARIVDIGTTLAVTTSDPLAARIARQTGASVEHLEAFAVATACGAEGVPFTAVLGVANEVGSRGREQWRSHHVAAGGAAARLVGSWVQAGAAGVPLAARGVEGTGRA